MRNRSLLLLRLLVTASVVALPLLGGTAEAAVKTATVTAPPAGEALEISPPVLDLTVNPGQTITTLLRIRDVSPTDLIVGGQVNDFVAAGENGVPKLLLNPSEDEDDPYSLRGWITNVPQLTLVPREIKGMNITIAVPKNASPGGHYGVIRFTATPPSLAGTGVSLAASLGTLVLLRVNGDIKEDLGVAEFSVNKSGKTSHFFESAPLDFVERLKNTGNVHLAPTGEVKIVGLFNKPVATLAINQPPHYVLPSSIRKFDESLDSSNIGSKRLFGRYTATLNVTYGESNKTLETKLVFWVIPWQLMLTWLIVLVVGFYALRFSLRRYNDYIVGKMTGGGGRGGRSGRGRSASGGRSGGRKRR